MLNSLDIEGRPQDTRVVVAMSGGVELLGDGGAAQGRGLRRRGRDAAALRPRCRDPSQGRLLRGPGHLRRACGGGAHRHSPLRAGLREPLQGNGDRSLCRELCRGRNAGARASSATSRSSFAICSRPRASSARKVLATGHYVASRALPGGGRALYRAREDERDQSYFLFATTREQLDLLRFPLGDRTKAETRELARQFALSVADKHDSQDICFVPIGSLHRGDRATQAGGGRARRHRRSRRPRARHACRHHPFHRRPAARARHRRRPSAVCGAARRRVAPGRGRAARGAAHQPDATARCELAGRGQYRPGARAPAGRRCSSRSAPRGRRSRRG